MYEQLIEKAIEAKEKALPVYSNFHVGAAVLTDDNKIYLGGNIEISSYGLTICAERLAVFKAVSEGERKFKALALTSDLDDFCPPCGACRQVMLDLCGPELDVIFVNKNKDTKVFKLKDLIPHSFSEGHLK